MSYDASGQLVSMHQGGAFAVTNYTRDRRGNMVKQHRNDNFIIDTFTYDEENRLLVSHHRQGARTSSTYSRYGLRRTFQLPSGPSTTMIWDGQDYLMELQ